MLAAATCNQRFAAAGPCLATAIAAALVAAALVAAALVAAALVAAALVAAALVAAALVAAALIAAALIAAALVAAALVATCTPPAAARIAATLVTAALVAARTAVSAPAPLAPFVAASRRLFAAAARPLPVIRVARRRCAIAVATSCGGLRPIGVARSIDLTASPISIPAWSIVTAIAAWLVALSRWLRAPTRRRG